MRDLAFLVSERDPVLPAVHRVTCPLDRTRLAATLVCFLPAVALVAIILWVIWTRTAQVPYWDEWAFVPLVLHADQGKLTLAELWAPHAGVHRIVLTRLVDLAIIRLTNWNRQVEMTFHLAISIGGAWLLYSLLRATLRSARLALALVVPLSLLYFSLGQFANWFAPFELALIGSLFGLLLAVRAVTARTAPLPWHRFGLALLGALIAMLSAFPGMMVWLAVLPTLVTHAHRDRRGRLQLLLWSTATLEAWLLYVAGFAPYPVRAPLFDVLRYIWLYLGAPLGYPSMARSEVFGVLAMALWPVAIALYWLLGGSLRRLLPWLDVSLFVTLCTLATVDGRIGVGPRSALFSRYQIYSALWWIALTAISALALERLALLAASGRPFAELALPGLLSRVRCRVVAMRSPLLVTYALLFVALCVSLVAANIAGLRDALLWQDVQRASQYRLYDFRTLPDSCIGLYYPVSNAAVVRDLAGQLSQTHYGIFAVPPSERQRLAQSEAASASQGCVKPYDFIDDIRPPGAMRPF